MLSTVIDKSLFALLMMQEQFDLLKQLIIIGCSNHEKIMAYLLLLHFSHKAQVKLIKRGNPEEIEAMQTNYRRLNLL